MAVTPAARRPPLRAADPASGAGAAGSAGGAERGAVPGQRAAGAPWPGAVAVVADDLTGAMDGGVQLLPRTAVEVLVSGVGDAPDSRVAAMGQVLARGAPARPDEDGAAGPASPARVADALPGAEPAADAPVLPVINTQSRGLPPAEAAARVRAVCRAVAAAGRTVWFKKIDSTLRGNVGAELAALHDALAPCVIVCTPALPAEGRTVQDGVLLVAGEPVLATPYRDEFPAGFGAAAESSTVIGVVRRQWPGCRAVHVPAPAGGDLQAALRGAPDLVVVDAASDDELLALAAAAGTDTHPERRVVWAGSAGLLRALAVAGGTVTPGVQASRRAPERLPSAARIPVSRSARSAGAGVSAVRAATKVRTSIVGVSGSRRVLARRQVDNAAAASPSSLVLRLSEVPDAVVREPRWRLTATGRATPADISGTAAAAQATAALDRGRDLFLCAPEPTESHSAPAAADALAALAADVLEAPAARPLALLLVGGDTAYACLRRVGIARLALAGEAEPYVPRARVIGGPWHGTTVITKAGGFGGPHTLSHICARLRRCG